MNARRRFVLTAFAAMTALGSAGCYFTTASTTGKSYLQWNSDEQLAMGDSLGGTVWSPVVRERIAMARDDFYGHRTATASAPAD